MDSSTPQVGTSSSFPSSSSTHSFTHDVFLSFRGPDTRNNITGHLYSALVDNGINTFIDNDLTRGEDISNELLQVIEGSRISIVVFSPNYAYSKWCLDELVKIFHCKESKQQIVYSIFYKVQPSEIRYQKGSFGEGIAHLSKYEDNLEKVESWKAALTQAATLSGWPIMEGRHEATVIAEIVKYISSKIMKYASLDVATYPVGIESRVESIEKLLNVAEEDPKMIGIWGVGGIGKTTLAKAVYNSISHKFKHSCFLANVREQSSSHEGLVKLQNNLLSKMNLPNVADVAEGINVLKEKLQNQKRVLLVLDDVNHINQLRNLAGGCDWFGLGSTVIITTKDTNCLEAHNFKKKTIYEAKELNDEEAFKFFCLNAIKGDKTIDEFSDLAHTVVRYAKGIPLVLEVLGSNLCSKSKDEWEDALEYYKKIPNQEVQEIILQRSYKELEYGVKEVFLHIACFFKNYTHRKVITILRSCDLNPTFALKLLKEKALIKFQIDPILEENIIWMHDLIEDMGKELVRRESPHEPGQRSRLWNYEDVRRVLENNKGTDRIKGIQLDPGYQQKIRLNSQSFINMENLKFLEVFDSYKLEAEVQLDNLPDSDKLDAEVHLDYLPNGLRAINWMDTSLQSLPANFNPSELGMLHMDGPCTIPLVEQGFKNMQNLKYIVLSDCRGLKTIGNLSGLTGLENLELHKCNDLVQVDPSVGCHVKLTKLVISSCRKLRKFQEKINLKSLETLDLSYCPLEFFPEIEGEMKSLSCLVLSRTSIKKLPCSVGNLTGLKSLSLDSCHKLTNVPSSIFCKLQRLEDLDLRWCDHLVTFPTKSESLHPPVFSAKFRRVRLDGCWMLKEISEFALEIESLDVGGCWNLEKISHLSNNLESTDPKMMARIELTDCWKLCDNLVEVAVGNNLPSHVLKKRKRMPSASVESMTDAEKLTAMLSLFMSCANSEEYLVKFPARAPIPNWLTHHHDIDVNQDEENFQNKEHEFFIEIPQNVDWDNKGLLALCMRHQLDEESDIECEEFQDEDSEIECEEFLDEDSEIECDEFQDEDSEIECDEFQEDEEKTYLFKHEIYINEVRFHDEGLESGNVWLHYIPMATIMRRLSESGMPPSDRLRVRFCFHDWMLLFDEDNSLFRGSWGVQLIDDRGAELQNIWKRRRIILDRLPDWQEEAYQKIKVMKETYLPQLSEMYTRVVSILQKQESSLPPGHGKLETLKMFKTIFEGFIRVLQLSKSDISPSLKDKLGSEENKMIKCINAYRARKAVSSLQLPPSGVHGAHLLQASLQLPTVEQQGESASNLVTTEEQQCQPHPTQQMYFQKTQYQTGHMQQHQFSLQPQPNPVQRDTHQSQSYQSHRSPQETSSTSLDFPAQTGYTDWQEEAYQKIMVMKHLYLADLSQMYWKIATKLQLDSHLQQQTSAQHQNLSTFKNELEGLITVLHHSKTEISLELKEKLVSYENQITDLIDTNRLRKSFKRLRIC